MQEGNVQHRRSLHSVNGFVCFGALPNAAATHRVVLSVQGRLSTAQRETNPGHRHNPRGTPQHLRRLSGQHLLAYLLPESVQGSDSRVLHHPTLLPICVPLIMASSHRAPSLISSAYPLLPNQGSAVNSSVQVGVSLSKTSTDPFLLAATNAVWLKQSLCSAQRDRVAWPAG